MTSTHEFQLPEPGLGAVLSRYWLPVLLVLLAHAGVLAALWPRAQGEVTPPQVMDVVMISAAEPAAPVPPPARPVPRVEPPRPKPVLQPEPVLKQPAPAPLPQPAAAPVASPPPVAAAPVPAPAEASPVIVPPRVDASYRGNVAPPYPPASRRLGEEGTVVLRIFVNADGSVGEVVLGKSSGYGRLDLAAQQAVKRWKLIPARRGNEPFATWYTLPFEFNLEK